VTGIRWHIHPPQLPYPDLELSQALLPPAIPAGESARHTGALESASATAEGRNRESLPDAAA
jgi:hypothetical protein